MGRSSVAHVVGMAAEEGHAMIEPDDLPADPLGTSGGGGWCTGYSVLPVRLQQVAPSTPLELTAAAHLSPDHSVLAVVDTRGNVRLQGVNSGHPLHGAVLPSVSSVAWVKLDPEVERKRRTWGTADRVVGPTALIAVDAASSILFVSSATFPAEPKSQHIGGVILCELRETSGLGSSAYLKNEVPKGRLKQILKKRGHVRPCESIILVRGCLQGALFVVDHSVAVRVAFDHSLRNVVLVDVSDIEQTPLWRSSRVASAAPVVDYAMTRAFWCQLHEDGTIHVFALGGGRCTAIVELARFAEAQTETFVALEVAPDGLFCAATTATGEIVVVDLEEYFSQHPEHREGFWRDSDLPVQLQDGAAAANGAVRSVDASAAADELSDDDEADEDEDEDEDEDGGGDLSSAAAIRGRGESLLRRGNSVLSGTFSVDATLSSERCWASERRLFNTIVSEAVRHDRNRSALTQRYWFEDGAANSTRAAATVSRRRRHSSSGLAAAHETANSPETSRTDDLPRGVVRLEQPRRSQPDNPDHPQPCALIGFAMTSVAVFASYRDGDENVMVSVCALDSGEIVQWEFGERAFPVQCERENPALHLTAASIVACIVGTTRRALVDELILLDQGQLARQLSALNDWDQQTLNSHQLENALRFRQLDNVEAVLDTIPIDQVESATEILLTTIEDASKLSKGLHFAQRLLFVATKHVMRAIRLRRESNTSETDIASLTRLLARLRQSLLRPKIRDEFSRIVQNPTGVIHDIPAQIPANVPVPRSASIATVAELREQEEPLYFSSSPGLLEAWKGLDDDAIIKDALLKGNLGAAQCFFMDRAANSAVVSDKAHCNGSFAEVRKRAMMLVYTSFVAGDTEQALALLRGIDVDPQTAVFECYSGDTSRSLRSLLAPVVRSLVDSDAPSAAVLDYMAAFDAAYPVSDPVNRRASLLVNRGGHSISDGDEDHPYSTILRIGGCVHPPDWCGESGDLELTVLTSFQSEASPLESEPPSADGAYSQVAARWALKWSNATRERVLLSVKIDDTAANFSEAAKWEYAVCHGDLKQIDQLLANKAPEDLRKLHFATPQRTLRVVRWHIENALCQQGVVPEATPVVNQSEGEGDAAHIISILGASKRLFGTNQSEPLTQDEHSAVVQACVEFNFAGVLLHHIEGSREECIEVLRREVVNGTAPPWVNKLLQSAIADNGGSPTSAALEYAPEETETDNSDSDMVWTYMSLAAVLYSGARWSDVLTNGLVVGDRTVISAADAQGMLENIPLLASHAKSYQDRLRGSDRASATQATPRLTLYDLLRGASFTNVTELLAFQESNATRGGTQTMPHFSGQVSDELAAEETLDYKYYLQQGRPLHAHDVYRKSVTTGTYVATPDEISRAVWELAITNFYDEAVCTACLMFMSMGHEDGEASLLRDDLAVAQRIFRHESRQFDSTAASAHIAADSPGLAASILRISFSETVNSDEVLAIVQRLDAATLWLDKTGPDKGTPTPGSSRSWELVCRYCRRFGLAPSVTFLKTCAEANDWVLFLGFAQSERFPLEVVKSVAKDHFKSESIKSHVDLVLKSMQLENSESDGIDQSGATRLLWLSKDGLAYVHGESAGGSSDLFDLVFRCEASNDPFEAYLTAATEYRLPQLAVLGACVGQNKLAVVCCWLLASISDSARSELSDLAKPTTVSVWTKEAFTTIVAQLARTDGMHLLVEALSIVFGPEATSTPLKHIAAFHACFNAFDFMAALNQLHDLRIGSEKLSPTSGQDIRLNSPAVVRETADAVIQVMIDSCDNSHESEHLLRLLSQANYSQEYVHLHQTYMIMNSVGMKFNDFDNPESCVTALIDRGLFNEARAYAQAHQLSEDIVTLKEIEAKLHEYENSRLWSLEKTRLDVWRQFQATFVDRKCSPDIAGTFFLERVQIDRGDEPSGNSPSLFAPAETVLLLVTALSWLNGSAIGSEPCRSETELEALETQVWTLKIEMEVDFNRIAPSDGATRSSSFVATSVRAGDDSLTRDGTIQQRTVRGWGTKEATIADSWSPRDVVRTDAQPEIPLVSTSEERQALDNLICSLLNEGDFVAASKLASRFQYQSRDLLLALTAFRLATESIAPKEAAEWLKDIAPADFSHLDTLQALRTLCQYCGPGEDCCRRLATNYTVARLLNMSYKAMLAQEAFKVLRHLVKRNNGSFDLAQQFISRNRLAKAEVSQLLGHQYVKALAEHNGDSPDGDRGSSPPTATDWASWGSEEFSQFANLCDLGVLGDYLLDCVYNDKPVHVDEGLVASDDDVKLSPSAEVTVLCRAHYCFVSACNTDAIDLVLAAARDLTSRFVAKRQFQPLIRLLTNVKRYRDMEYIFDALVDNDRFELLLAKDRMAGDPVGVSELKAVLRDYLLRRHPKDTEKLQMVSLHFTMYREIGENRLTSARQHIRALGKHAPGSSKLKDLLFIIQMLSEAAQNLMTEECQRQARKCLTLARLVGLQVQMVDLALLNLDRSDVSRFLVEHGSFKESLIVAQAYDQCAGSDWINPIYTQVVQRGNLEYLEEAQSSIRVTTGMFKECAAIFLRDPTRNECAANFQRFLGECTDIFTQYGLAKETGLVDFAEALAAQHSALVRT